MSSPVDILHCSCWEDGGLWLAARIYGNAGTAITQASLSSISYTVFDETNSNAVVVASTALTISSVVYDTLQTSDPRWTVDATGFNFSTSLGADCFPTGGRRVRIEVKFVPVSGAPFWFVTQVEVRDVLTS